MKKKYRISKEVKEQILARIKNDGITVAGAAKEHGISTQTIYGWLGSGVKGQPTVLEMSKLKRENKALLELVGKLTASLDRAQKNS